ncbi:T9SS type A sorting domain-containing protein [Flavobacterium noncentrifugens]|uniref:Por secretion system C-terminal sorting domain-containing protein n=1 Tax=Flavobacterium noncentrifugens TaxID=1128970 RepID=A0A1G8SIW7_9FLAO|nr:T9SS type A sorting domain-containing protein [Flavobacterium noncentrifugens]SDJ29103.1 Por secretion system C-terminal sorting domain-containing protein [Flavobacterium noncentrifugens]
MIKLSTRLIFAACSLIVSLGVSAQDMLWEKSYGGKNAEYLFDAVPTADYGFILAGSSLSGKTGNKVSEGAGDLDFWVWKMNENGDMDWQKSFGGIGSDFLQSIRLTRDGGFILAGNSDSARGLSKKEDSHGGEDFWVIKLDAGGGEQWQKTIGGTGQEKLKSIAQTRDGGYILGGSSSSEKSADKKQNSYGNLDYWVVKLDKEGKILWEKTFGGIYFEELRSIEQTADQGYILGGYSNSPASGNKKDDNIGTGDYWVIKLDRDGEEEWQQVIGGDKDDELAVVHQTYDGGYLLGGNSNSGSNFSKKKGNGKGTDFWLVKLDKEGGMIWQETYDFGTSDILTSIVENKDHTLLIGGFAKSEANGKKKDEKGINDYIALKISETGERLWDKTVGSDGEDILTKVVETRDGGYLLAGTSNPVRSTMGIAGTKSGSGTGNGISVGGNGQQLQGLKNATDKANGKIAEAAESFNKGYDETVGAAADKINKATDLGEDSPLKFGVNAPKSPLGNVPSLGSGGSGSGMDADKAMDGLSSALGGGKANIPPSRDKKTHYGNSDFWVVKLLDKDKEKVKKATIEAIPNPAGDFTNVIVGYEFETGTATVVDLSGHILQSFTITGRTVPVNLSAYPEGIYIVNIKTDVQSDGIKVIKQK